MPTTVLLTANGDEVEIREGNSVDFIATPSDLNGDPILKANVASLTVSMYDSETGVHVNGLKDTNVLDANGGTVSTAGVLTLRVDNCQVHGDLDPWAKQVQKIRLTWGWNDGVSDREVSRDWDVRVEKLLVVS